jgi:peroxiredoxin
MKAPLLLLAALLSPLALSAAVETGEPAPGFTLTDTEGNEHSLSDFEGQYVVLEWLNHQCPFVVRHYESGNMQALQEKYTDQGVVWLSIVSSAPGKQGYFPPEKANQLTEEKSADPTAVLIDSSGTVGKAYGARTTPHMYVIDPEGVLVYQGAIDDQPRGRNPSEATNYVVEALEASMDGEEVEVASTRPYGCSVKY